MNFSLQMFDDWYKEDERKRDKKEFMAVI